MATTSDCISYRPSGLSNILTLSWQPIDSANGSVVFLRDTLAALNGHGHRTQCIALLGEHNNAIHLPNNKLRLLNGQILSDPTGLDFKNAVRQMTDAALDLYEEEHFQLIWAHHTSYPHSVAALNIANATNVRLAVQIHGPDLAEAEQNGIHHRQAQAVLAAANVILVPSRDLEKRVNSAFIGIEKKIRVTPLFLPRALSEELKIMGRDQAIDILFVGRLDQNKGFSLLFDAFLSSKACSLVAVGAPDEQAIFHWNRRSLEAKKTFRHVGYQSRSLMPEFYRQAKMIVIPTLHHEGFSLVALESLAAGRPIVATSAGALPEVLGAAAIIVETTVDSLQKGINIFVNDQGTRQSYCSRATERYRTIFSPCKSLKHFINALLLPHLT